MAVGADEVESVLGVRREQEHEAITSMKTEFMQLWDGFSTDSSANVMVLAATNRPFGLDDAVLRRCALPYPPPSGRLNLVQCNHVYEHSC